MKLFNFLHSKLLEVHDLSVNSVVPTRTVRKQSLSGVHLRLQQFDKSSELLLLKVQFVFVSLSPCFMTLD